MNSDTSQLILAQLPAAEITSRGGAGVWEASLALRFEQRDRGCRLVQCLHRGPLYVQKPFYPEGDELAHVYLLHPPGGLVSGDNLRIDLTLEPDTQVLVTTPGAARVYRARADRRLQRQAQQIEVGPGASMEWLPQETIVYPDANGCTETRVDLAADSRFFGWEITCLGLPAGNRQFGAGSMRQSLLIYRERRPVVVDRLQLCGDSDAVFTASAGMQGLPVSGILAAGPIAASEELLNRLRQETSALESPAIAGVTLMNGFVLARYLGPSSEQAKDLFVKLWEVIRPELNGRPAVHPRIWAT